MTGSLKKDSVESIRDGELSHRELRYEHAMNGALVTRAHVAAHLKLARWDNDGFGLDEHYDRNSTDRRCSSGVDLSGRTKWSSRTGLRSRLKRKRLAHSISQAWRVERIPLFEVPGLETLAKPTNPLLGGPVCE